jgi:hypothetical protein
VRLTGCGHQVAVPALETLVSPLTCAHAYHPCLTLPALTSPTVTVTTTTEPGTPSSAHQHSLNPASPPPEPPPHPLPPQVLDLEEAKARRERLAKMRSLLFYQEVKARHTNKIKSKEYHRKLSKAAKRKAAAAGEEVMDEDAARVEQEQAEFERAKVGGLAWGSVCACAVCWHVVNKGLDAEVVICAVCR